MRTAPLFPVACGLIAGITADRLWQSSLSVYVALLVGVSILAFPERLRAAVGPILVLIAATCVGGILHLNASRTIPASSIERFASEDRSIVRVRGIVASEPRVLDAPENPFSRWTFGHDRTAFLFDPEWIGGLDGDIPVTGRVRVTVGEALLDLRENELVEVFGWLYLMKPPGNPGSFDWAEYHRRQGIVAGMYCKHQENIRRVDPDPPYRRMGFRSWLRSRARGLLTDDLATGTDEEGSLLETMVLGHRSRLDRRLNEIFIRAGCIHFLAVSGTHVAVLLSFVWLAGRLLMGTRRQCAWLTIAAVCAYALIAEPRPPIFRATVMALLFCASLILRRSHARLNWISAAAAVLVICNPLTVFDVGFQLSFAAVLGVTYLTGAILEAGRTLRAFVDRVILRRPFADMDRQIADDALARLSPIRWRLRRAARSCLVLFPAVSLSAWLAGVPVVAVHFSRIQPWGPLASVAVYPLVCVVMIGGVVKMIASACLPILGSLIAKVLVAADRLLIGIVERLSSLPGATITVAAPPWWSVLPVYVVLLLFIWHFPGRRKESLWNTPTSANDTAGRSRWSGPACGAGCLMLLVTGVAWPLCGGGTGGLVVTVLSVGAGSATVLELPDGRTLVYDAGSMNPHDVGKSTVVPFLRHRGITRIDEVYLSHPNLDHFSALPSILDEVQTGPVVINEYFGRGSPPRSPSRHLLETLAARAHPIETLDPVASRRQRGEVMLEVLYPNEDLYENVSANDTSTVLRISYAGHAVLLAGDVMDYAQRELLRQGGVEADVLVLPHHGSAHAMTREFVDTVGADVLIRSSDEGMDETYSALPDIVRGRLLYNTADDGAVQVVIDEAGIRVSSMRGGLTSSHTRRH